MARIAKNSLRIAPLQDGRFYLTGSCSAKFYRLKFLNLHEAETKKAELENDEAKMDQLAKTRPELRFTWLSPEQLRIAEGAFQIIGDSGLTVPEIVTRFLKRL